MDWEVVELSGEVSQTSLDGHMVRVWMLPILSPTATTNQPPTPTSLKLEVQVHKSDLGISDLVTPFESAGASRWWSWPLLEETTYPWHKEPHRVSCGFHRVDRTEPLNCMPHHAYFCFTYLSPQGAPGLLCLWTFPFWPCPLESSNPSHSCLSGLKE